MTSPAQTTKLDAVNDADKVDWPVAGGRVHPEHLRLIDVAAAIEGVKRGPFVADAAVERARRVIEEKSPDLLAQFPAA